MRLLLNVAAVGLSAVLAAGALAEARRTTVSMAGATWQLNGQVTYPRTAAEGLLMNVRMVNAVFEDANDATRPKGFDPDVNTRAFIRKVPAYVSQGARAFTIGLQGGDPGYEGAVNTAFAPDGSLRESYLARVARVIEAADRHGAVVILSCFYQRQDQTLRDEGAVRAGVANVARWIRENRFTNVVLEIANEFGHKGFDHSLLRSAEGQVELMRLARQTAPGLLVSSSAPGDGRIPDDVARESDFLLPHFNETPLEAIAERVTALKKYGKPVVCNEDDKIDEQGAKAAETAVTNGISWGFMRKTVNQHHPFRFHGPDDDPIVYAMMKRLTTRPRSR
jgi:hypothetical protein